MSIPANLTPVTVTNTYIDELGNRLTGYTLFTPTVPLYDGATGNIILSKGIVAPLVNGLMTAALFATDSVALQPSGWGWQVDETNIQGGSGRLYYITIPSSAAPSANLAALPTAVPAGLTLTTGVIGPQGPISSLYNLYLANNYI